MKTTTYQEAGDARRLRHPKEPAVTPVEAPSPYYSAIRSSSSKPKDVAELANLKELESLVRELMDRVPLPQVWDNRLHKQLSSIERVRANG